MIARAEGTARGGFRAHGRPWLGVLGPPALVLLGLATNYALVPWACGDGGLPMTLLHLVSALLLLGTLAAGFAAWRVHRDAGGGWPGEEGTPPERNRFLGLLGILSAGYFTLVLLGLWIPTWILDPCLRAS